MSCKRLVYSYCGYTTARYRSVTVISDANSITYLITIQYKSASHLYKVSKAQIQNQVCIQVALAIAGMNSQLKVSYILRCIHTFARALAPLYTTYIPTYASRL